MDKKSNFKAMYVMIDKNIKNEIQIIDTAFDIIENELDIICDIDVMWDGIHFILTKVPNFEDSKNILSGLIYGFEVLEDNKELFCSYTSFDNLKELMKELEEKGDIELLNIDNFDKDLFVKNNIVPFKLYKAEDSEYIYDELLICLEELEDFYNNALEQNKAVVCVFSEF